MHAFLWGLGLFILLPDFVHGTRRAPVRARKGKENFLKKIFPPPLQVVMSFIFCSPLYRALHLGDSLENEWISTRALEYSGLIPLAWQWFMISWCVSNWNFVTLRKKKLFGTEWLWSRYSRLIFNIRMHGMKHLVIDKSLRSPARIRSNIAISIIDYQRADDNSTALHII